MISKRIFLIPIVILAIIIFSVKIFKFDRNKFDTREYIAIAQSAKPKSLDPHKFNDFSVLAVTEHIFNTLVSVDDNGNIIPELAESWKFESPKTIIFNIRKGIKFHNGEILTARDVVFSLKRMMGEPATFSLVNDIKEVEELDDYTVKVSLHKISAPFLSNLTTPLTAILNEKEYLKNSDSISVAPVGTGPFKIREWGDGEKIILDSNKEYFKGAPSSKGIIFKTIVESSTRVAALEAGEVDIIYGIAPSDYRYIEKNPNLYLMDLASMSTDYIVLNTKKNYLNNKEIRKAIHYAMDKAGIIDAIFLEKGRVASSPVSPAIFGSYQGINGNIFNPLEAKTILLKEKIKEDEIFLKIWTSENSLRVQIAQIIQANLENIGIKSQIEIIELGTLLTKTANGEHDIFLTTWITGVTDADTTLTPLFHSKSLGKAGNRSFYSNNKLDRILDDARETIEKEERIKLYKRAQEVIWDDNSVIPLVYRVDGIALSRKIKNFSYNKSSMRKYYEKMEKIN